MYTRRRSENGTHIYVETSQRLQYAATLAFYENRGYRRESVLEDFYGPEDDKVTYCKVLKSMPEQQNARLKSYEITPDQ